MQHLLRKGRPATTTLWPPLPSASRLVRQAAEILAKEPRQAGAQVRERSRAFLAPLPEQQAALEPLSAAREHFGPSSETYAAGRFQGSDEEGFPRTTNALGQCCGVARVHERRATRRRGAIPGVVVRGAVRLVAAVVTKQRLFAAEELRPSDYRRGRALRVRLQQGEETRRQQFRFRKNPAADLAALEAQLLT